GTTTMRDEIFMRLPLFKSAWIGDAAFDGACCCCKRRCEQRPGPLTLASLKIPVTGADGCFAGRNGIAVHRDAHAASGFTPLGAGFLEDAIQPLGFRLTLHLIRPRHNEHSNAWTHFASSDNSCGTSKIRQSAVRAASNKHNVDRMPEQR